MARGSKLRRRQTDELVHSSGIGLRHLAAVRCDAVIAPPLVIQMRVGAVLGFFDETLFEHLVDRSIEHAGAKLQLSARAQRNLALQCVAVAFPFGERQKNVENGGREGYTVFVGHTSTRSDIILPKSIHLSRAANPRPAELHERRWGMLQLASRPEAGRALPFAGCR